MSTNIFYPIQSHQRIARNHFQSASCRITRNMRILIIEDEHKVASFLRQGLEEEGWIVHLAFDGEDGLQKIISTNYDVVVLDIMLPKLDGLSVLKQMREAKVEAPVLLLTARDTVPDKVKGLYQGANDYMTKPFAFEELLARLHVLTRPRAGSSDGVIQVADLKLDPVAHKVFKGGKEIALTAMEFRLLELLLRNAGRVVSRLDIEELVWDKNYDHDTNIVDVYINYLRKKIDKPTNSHLIKTIRGFGYKIDH